MELSPRQQKLAFAAIVVALAGLGLYLFAGRSGSHGPANAASTSHSSASAPATPAAAPTTASPSGTSTGSASGVNIYQWLPFSQPELAQASAMAISFAANYQTYSYTDSPAAYGARMQRFATSEEVQTLESAYSTLGVAQTRTSQQQVSTASAAVSSLYAFGPSSITFVVAIHVKLTSTKGPADTITQYRVTVVNAGGGSWQVSDVQPASAGNQ